MNPFYLKMAHAAYHRGAEFAVWYFLLYAAADMHRNGGNLRTSGRRACKPGEC